MFNEHSTVKQDAPWDPLEGEQQDDPDLFIAAKRREIRNILKSYTGYYDVFAEMIQNALDAVERRIHDVQNADDYKPSIWVEVNMDEQSIAVTDNGIGMDLSQFRRFLRPNFSFKTGSNSRGNKGVGATYLAYGFNELTVATKSEGVIQTGVLARGREWLEDDQAIIARPKVTLTDHVGKQFQKIDRGTYMKVRLLGRGIRPKNLSWIGAKTAYQWMAVLRASTPLGAVYLCGDEIPPINVEVSVVREGERDTANIDSPQYLYPHEVTPRVVSLRDYLDWQKKAVQKGSDVSQVPHKFRKVHGIWGAWTGEDILSDRSLSPISPRLSESEKKLVRQLDIKLYICLVFSTDVWDSYNDENLGLRKGSRILSGGLQLATRNMPQGSPITIPMTNNIGFQNLAHVIVHLENAEPDLGRKGFQPEVVKIAEKLSVAAVTAFRKYYKLLRKPTGAKIYTGELDLDQWIRRQEAHETTYPLVIKGKGLFMPQEELPITSEPIVEQDVVALFNQMLSSGLVRGIQLISSSQFNQYDGLYRIKMGVPISRYIYNSDNPLGVDKEVFDGKSSLQTPVKIIEYKYSLDALIEEIQNEVKSSDDISLAVAWKMGQRWNQMFDVVSYLDDDHVHLRQIHGTTHSFLNQQTGESVFEAVILQDLISYLQDPSRESDRQKAAYAESALL